MPPPSTRQQISELRADDLVSWPHLPHPQLVDAIAGVVAELFGLYQEAAMVEMDERRTKSGAYASSAETSVTMRDRDATASALPMTLMLVELRGRIVALESAREFGYMLLGTES